VSPGSSVSAHSVVASRPSFPTQRRSRATSRSWNGSWTRFALPWCTYRWKESCRPSNASSLSSYGLDEPSNTHPAATRAIVQSEAPYLDPSTNYWRRHLQNSLICIFCKSLQNYEAWLLGNNSCQTFIDMTVFFSPKLGVFRWRGLGGLLSITCPHTVKKIKLEGWGGVSTIVPSFTYWCNDFFIF
jgi:hypothetical protein